MSKKRVIIVGGGAAGLTAAVAAAEVGAQVTILEKNGNTGGNGVFPEGMFAVESSIQRKMMVEATCEDYFKRAMSYAHWRLNPRLMRAIIDKSGETIDWLMGLGVQFETAVHHMPGYPEVFHVANGSGTGIAVIKALRKKIQELGIEVKLRTSATELIVSNGAVKGVRGISGGQPVAFEGDCVIIATGGFAGNADIIRRFIPGYDEKEVLNDGGIRHKGDGFLMAEAAGAGIDEHITLEAAGPRFHGPRSIGFLVGKPHVLWLNSRGMRFADEGLVYNFSESANSVWRQPGKVCYVILDEAIKNYLVERGLDHPVEARALPEGSLGRLESDLAAEDEKGKLKICNTLDEIAEFIGVNTQKTEAAIAEYNQCCTAGHDPVFAKDGRYLRPIGKAPYYVIKTGVGMVTTHGGIRADEHMAILDKSGEPIAGLYGAGVDIGGVDGDTYQLALSGHAFSFSINGGRIAGRNAASEII